MPISLAISAIQAMAGGCTACYKIGMDETVAFSLADTVAL
jgi:hypothetical protein